jgi:hypothetical protein
VAFCRSGPLVTWLHSHPRPAPVHGGHRRLVGGHAGSDGWGRADRPPVTVLGAHHD